MEEHSQGRSDVTASMRVLDVGAIGDAVCDLLVEATHQLGDDVMAALKKAQAAETGALASGVIADIIANASAAQEDDVPLCQDTGAPIVYLRLGQGVALSGGELGAAVADGVRRATVAGHLRRSIVEEPVFERRNLGDAQYPFLHLELVPGQDVTVVVLPKGGGCENMSVLRMLKPADGLAGVKELVMETVRAGAVNSCPPLIVGVGVGGTFDSVGWIAKSSLFRRLDSENPDERLAAVEAELLRDINQTGIGAMGWGGTVTALAVHVKTAPTHIASLPCAVNLQCHSHRVRQVTL